jgi:hypothetical protein
MREEDKFQGMQSVSDSMSSNHEREKRRKTKVIKKIPETQTSLNPKNNQAKSKSVGVFRVHDVREILFSLGNEVLSHLFLFLEELYQRTYPSSLQQEYSTKIFIKSFACNT